MHRLALFVCTAATLLPVSAFAAHVSLPTPTGLNAVAAGDDVTVSWTAYPFPSGCSVNPSGMLILRDGTEIHKADITASSYVDLDLAVGNYSYAIRAKCQLSHNNQSATSEAVNVAVVAAASCASAPTVTVAITPDLLWPPNGKAVAVALSGHVEAAPNCSLPAEISYAITDEYGDLNGAGTAPLDGTGAFSFVIDLEASRRGNDLDGRLYTVLVTAEDAGFAGSETVGVLVPHDRRKK